MYPFNRFLGVSNSVTLDGIDQLRFENSSITIHNLNIDNVNNLNSVNGGEGGSNLTYLMAGEGKAAGLASYLTQKPDDEHDNMCQNYEDTNIPNYKASFGIIDFEESDTKGKFKASNGIVAPYFAAVSDQRAKSDIRPIESALEKIMQLKGYKYILEQTGEQSAGVMAQEVLRVMPEAVMRSSSEKGEHQSTAPLMAVNYNALIPLLVEGLKELSKRTPESRATTSDHHPAPHPTAKKKEL